MDVWIGTSGYSYPDWVGEFYPRGTRPERMLNYYSEHFPLVELNFTFYRAPTRTMLLRLADKTPPGFQFLVKVPQTISHDASAADLPGFRYAVEGLQKRGQLLGLLYQLPQSRHNTREARDWLRRVAEELDGLKMAVEFRHRSWAVAEMPAWLAGHGLDLVAVDEPDLPGLFPSGWVQSSPRVYVRLHSRDAGKWYKGEKERYDYLYSDAELAGWAQAAQAHEGNTEEALFLFNNCHRSQAVVNARRLRELIESQAPELHVVEPTGPQKPVQRSLFES
jgi:uncharacterized protein YecE (DUF72 family)